MEAKIKNIKNVRGCKQKFSRKKIIGVSATKSWEKSRNFRYGWPREFFNKGQKTQGGGRTAPSPFLHGLEG